jgi:hypothetical protein
MSKRFPSGPWTGFYTESFSKQQFPMNLQLVFSHGRISGSGDDGVGSFTIEGRYDERSKECAWIKQYIGAHKVAYSGGADHHGIWGLWHLWGRSGGFHIWPLCSGSGNDETLAIEEPLPLKIPTKVHALAQA